MALITLASSSDCGYCRKFDPKWNKVISALGDTYSEYFSNPGIESLRGEVRAVPQLIIRDKHGRRMGHLEKGVLKGWRSAKNTEEAIDTISDIIGSSITWENESHSDLGDFATHLKLHSTAKRRNRGKDFKLNPSDSEVSTPSLKGRGTLSPLQKSLSLNSVLETSYVVGDEMSYYGSDSIGCINI